MDLKITPKKPEQLEKEHETKRVESILTETPEQARGRMIMDILKNWRDECENEALKTKEEFENSIQTINSQAFDRNMKYIHWFESLGGVVDYIPKISAGSIGLYVSAIFEDKVKFNGINFEKFISLVREVSDFQMCAVIGTKRVEISYYSCGIGKYIAR